MSPDRSSKAVGFVSFVGPPHKKMAESPNENDNKGACLQKKICCLSIAFTNRLMWFLLLGYENLRKCIWLLSWYLLGSE